MPRLKSKEGKITKISWLKRWWILINGKKVARMNNEECRLSIMDNKRVVINILKNLLEIKVLKTFLKIILKILLWTNLKFKMVSKIKLVLSTKRNYLYFKR